MAQNRKKNWIRVKAYTQHALNDLPLEQAKTNNKILTTFSSVVFHSERRKERMDEHNSSMWQHQEQTWKMLLNVLLAVRPNSSIFGNNNEIKLKLWPNNMHVLLFCSHPTNLLAVSFTFLNVGVCVCVWCWWFPLVKAFVTGNVWPQKQDMFLFALFHFP